ncbi:DnaJ domain-containing protein [Clostridium botulinum]|uniref:DnaJ domain-containing protein n=1 Tax=Clostridium botulinum TaxID=1491 RepID=UPI001E4C57FF|nr:DnaJ domain-containing protein [Clostridium botulinum]MCD3254364.1 DnaJ domain-containing protein [Clostridium botulinum C/D]MCD3279864.1 DnaJ domain-containing protein [Clostridium botulinum C/D]MCD3339595.1 DnaJ domain-containing protein [Clostridium botulinum C/D]MCD3357503.1 DnaJ domain-containing protein [Clostridium botulinum C/D]
MYINIIERKKKEVDTSCYIYLCESKRVDGKVKTIKKHLHTFDRWDLTDAFNVKKLINDVNMKFIMQCDSNLELVNKLNANFVGKLNKIQQKLFQESDFARELYEGSYKIFNDYQANEKCSYKNVTTKKNTFEQEIKQELIKAGYKTLSKKYHPDMLNGDEEKFKILSEVFEQLKNM